ncbi:MAG: hypothetical protein ACOC1F_10765 [Myxococcota bacterium]
MLPIRKVILYKHGVGYFERQGHVDGDSTIELHFRASEMNDVLKSLTVLDFDGGLVSSVSYESTKPVEKQLEDVAVRIPDDRALTGLIDQVKGARVSVQVGPDELEGLVAGIEAVSRTKGDAIAADKYLSLLVDGATLRSFDVLQIKRLTFLDESLQKDLGHLLSILIAAKKKDLKRLTIFARGEGNRRVNASYVVETPVWKTSYRLLLGEREPVIQGWALVDNTQDEDWENVTLSLVAGLPVSFVHDLYSPRYKRRPVVQVREEEAYAPPVLEAANFSADDEVEEMFDDDEVHTGTRVAGMPMPAPKLQMAAEPMASRAMLAEQSTQVQTRTVEVGDQFHYVIDNPVSVRRSQSALVPILQSKFKGCRAAVFNPEVRERNPMSAVLLENTTGMTLEGGPLTVFDHDTYVGESMLETMKPDEERLVPYSVELGCTVSSEVESDDRPVDTVFVHHGTLSMHRYQVHRRVYTIRNKTPHDLDLFLEHRFRHGWDLFDTPAPYERTDNFYRFRIAAPTGQTISFAVSEKGDVTESFSLINVHRGHVRAWVSSQHIDEDTRVVLEGLVELNEAAADLARRIADREEEVSEIFRNQERLRKNLQALGSSHDEKGLRERYVAELSSEEDKLRAVRSEIRRLKVDKKQADKDMRAKIAQLDFERRLDA